MTSTFRLLCAAMPEIAKACEQISDPHLRDRAFDVLVGAARDSNTGSTYGGIAPETSYSGYAPIAASTLPSSYDPTSTRVDNGGRG
jgi:hypothetical protein